MARILHLIQCAATGGAYRAAMAIAKYTSRLGDYQHSVASLVTPEQGGVELAQQENVEFTHSQDPEVIKAKVAGSDIVHIHWWNNPELDAFLRTDLPESRILAWFHVGGHAPPQIVTDQIVGFVDFALACSPFTYECRAIQSLPEEIRSLKAGMAYGPADFARLEGFTPRAHTGFNIGYIGTIDYLKMHPRYFEMSAAADIPDAKFIVCGGGSAQYDIKHKYLAAGLQQRFELRGYVNDVKSVLEILDIYGYPLCEDTYAASEVVLQEAMYAGIAPVVFPYGGVQRLVEHGRSGYVVHSEREYTEALEHLYHDPAERARIGASAAQYAREIFGAENAAKVIHDVYQKMLQQPKHRHVWGADHSRPLLEQDVRPESVRAAGNGLSPAEIFIETLGEYGEPFRISLQSENLQELLAADEQITEASETLKMSGINPYKGYYPSDPYLKMWSGLAYLNSAVPEQALVNFSEALSLPNGHWRVVWYFALAAVKCRQWDLAEQALQQLHVLLPGFDPARMLAEEIKQRDVVIVGNGLRELQWKHATA